MTFRMMPGALGEEPVRLIYPELLKRLDDSNDMVRHAVCGTISAFFKVGAWVGATDGLMRIFQ